MPTRREVLLGGLALPGFPPSPSANGTTILAEDHCLSAESASGFRALLESERTAQNRSIVILPANCSLTREHAAKLRRQASAGSLLLIEIAAFASSPAERREQARIFRDIFAVDLSEPVNLSPGEWAGDYVRFTGPLTAHVRTFCAVTPVRALGATVLAGWNGHPVCVAPRIGAGGLVVLGSMLGPGLLAHDREARNVASALLKLS